MTAPITIIGMSAGGSAALPTRLVDQILCCDVLVGGQRHLGYFPKFTGESIAISSNIAQVEARLQQAVCNRERAVVLASGDPLCYGIGSTLRRTFPPEALHIEPAPTAFQMAFAALAEPWHDAACLSAHARPLPEVIDRTLRASKAAILTDNIHTPAMIAQALLDAGAAAHTPCAICENLGSTTQQIIKIDLQAATKMVVAPLNVFVVWPVALPPSPISPGLPDDQFSTLKGQITKREIRLLSLAELALGAGEVMWDIGAGSGAVSIEAARVQPTARIFAVEKRATMIDHMRTNIAKFPVGNLYIEEAFALDVLTSWPDPHAIFIGGSGNQLTDIIQVAQQRLHPAGRLVINLATLDNLHRIRQHLPDANIVQVQINRAVPIQAMTRFEALNPVFIATWRKQGENYQ